MTGYDRRVVASVLIRRFPLTTRDVPVEGQRNHGTAASQAGGVSIDVVVGFKMNLRKVFGETACSQGYRVFDRLYVPAGSAH